MKYSIQSVLSLVTDDASASPPSSSSSHLLLHTTHEATGADWFCFNDYSIAHSTIENALSFTDAWRSPICLVYHCSDFPEDSIAPLLTAPTRPPPQPFYSPSSLGAPDAQQTFVMLPNDKLPGRNDLISIDCEFIALTCEQVTSRLLCDLGGHHSRRSPDRAERGRSAAGPRDLSHARSHRVRRRLHSLRGPRRRLSDAIQRTEARGPGAAAQQALSGAAEGGLLATADARGQGMHLRGTWMWVHGDAET